LRGTDPYELQQKIGQWILGGFAAAVLAALLGAAGIPFFLQSYDMIYLVFLVIPGFLAPVAGFLVWFFARLRWPHVGRGAVVFGTTSFLLTATCWAALGALN
jgi:hypothetical protein